LKKALDKRTALAYSYKKNKGRYRNGRSHEELSQL
jgi:hypothetical protein